MNSANLRDSAFAYAKRGRRIFPVVGKAPHGKFAPHGFKSATADMVVINSWFSNGTPPTGIAFEPGTAGMLVVDIDDRNDGFESIAQLEARFGPLPPTTTALTPGGGEHRYFELANGVVVRSHNEAFGDEFPGVDVKSTDGYVLLPGSRHPNGGDYAWDAGEVKPVPLPASWLELLKSRENEQGDARRFVLPERILEGRRRDVLFRFACSLRDRGMTAAEILAALRTSNELRCEPPLGDRELVELANAVEQRYEPKHDAFADARTEWPALHKVEPLITRTPPMTPDLLPESFRAYVVDAADRMNVAIELIAVPLIVATASLFGDIRVRPKRSDLGWSVTPNLWGVLVARPARMKTPSIDEALRPVTALQSAENKRFAKQRAEDGITIELAKASIAQLERELRMAGDDPGLAADLTSKREVLANLENARPRRYIVNDATHEKIGELLAVNDRGVLLVRDELTGWLQAIDDKDRAGARPFFLQSWNGGQPYVFDRINRGTTEIPRLTVSVLGGIQPALFARYIARAHDGRGDDGLLQRLQLLVWPDEQPEWKKVDCAPDAAAYATVLRVIEALDDETKRNAFGARHDDALGVYVSRFVPAAQDAFDAWRDELEIRLRGVRMELSPGFEAHIAKYRSLVPTLALVFHAVDTVLGDVDTGPDGISFAATQRAIAWAAYLEGHARKVYDREGPEVAVGALVERIEDGAVTDGMPVREIGRKCWRGLDEAGLAYALEALAAHHWLRVDVVAPTKQGRPSRVVRLHPDLRRDAK